MPDRRPGPLTLARKLAARIRSRGASEILTEIRSRGRELRGIDQRLIFFVRPTDPRPSDESPAPTGWRMERATPADGPAYARDIGSDSASTFTARLSDATRCWLLWESSTIVHASWYTTAAAWTRELGRYFLVPPGAAYLYESFTRPEARGRGIYPLVLRTIASHARDASISRLWIGAEATNAPSIKAITKAGFEPAFEVSYRRRAGRVRLDPPTGRRASQAAVILAPPDRGKVFPQGGSQGQRTKR